MRQAESHYIGTAEISRELKITKETVRKAFQNGELEGSKPGKEWCTTRSELNRWVEKGNR